MYKFNYDEFPKEQFDKLISFIKDDTEDRTYFGAIRVGDLCFDIIFGDGCIDGDLYIGGVDDGYGYSWKDKGYPYTFGFTGADVKFDEFVTYEQYKALFEARAVKVIERNPEWTKKAKEELHIW